MDVGFIGVGRMGRAMVGNLLQAGHRVIAWDISASAMEQVSAIGASVAASASDAFCGDAVLSMLPNDEAIRAVFLSGGVLPQRGGSTIVHVNMATASVDCARALTEAHVQRGIGYLSAPVFGRPELAARREINILAAGPAAAIDKVQPLFDALGKKTWRLGEVPANANVTKIAGNLMVACMLKSMGETAALARAYHMAPADLLGVVIGSIFDVPVYHAYADLVCNEAFEPVGFDLRLALKDTRLALAAGEAANLPLPFASVLRDNYLDALAHGGENKDWSIVTQVAARRAALDVL